MNEYGESPEQEKVRQFVLKHRFSVPDDGIVLVEHAKPLAIALMAEELAEVAASVGYNVSIIMTGIAVNSINILKHREPYSRAEDIAKELGDLLYVVYYTAVRWGIPLRRVFDAVHESNMLKVSDGSGVSKVMKGPHYRPPDIQAVLRSHHVQCQSLPVRTKVPDANSSSATPE